MRITVNILVIFFLTSGINAQPVYDSIKVTGIIYAQNDTSPVKHATITLLSGKLTQSKMTQPNGRFTMETTWMPDSLLVNAFGFDPLGIQIVPGSHSIIDLGRIFIKPKLSGHDQVTIIGARPVVFGLNKITYNVQADPENKGLPMLEVVQKVPLVDVGANDKIYVNGKTNFIVLINGRNSGITGIDPAPLLKTLQSASVSRIEVITDPPLKYKNDGYDYLINIIMEKKRMNGVYGSVTAGANTFGGYLANSLLMIKFNKLNITSLISYSKSMGRPGDYFYENINKKTGYMLRQQGVNVNKSHSLTLSSELTYEIDTVRLLSAGIYSSGTRLNAQSALSGNYFKYNSEYALVRREGINKENSGFRYALADYEVLKNKKRDVLTLSGRWYRVFSDGDNWFNDDDIISGQQTKTNNLFRSTGDEYTLQGNLSKYINAAYSFELGAKEIFRQYIAENTGNGLWMADLDYKQTISVLYSSWTWKKKTGSFKTGLSFNHAYFRYNENRHVNKGSFTYLNVLPYMNLARMLKKNKSLSVNYTMTVRRPGLIFLSPVIRYVNPENLQTGNPELRPELIHSVDFFYNTFLKKKALVLGMGITYSGNTIAELTKPYRDSLTLRTYVNNGRYFKLNSSISYSTNLSKKLNFRLNSDVGYLVLNNKSLKLKNDGIVYKAFVTLTYQMPWKFRLSSQNYIYSNDYNLQGWVENFTDLRIYLSRKFLNDNLNVGITWYQPYSNTIKLESRYEDNDFVKYSWSRFPARYLGISVSYDFGDFGKVMKREKKRTIVNADVK